MYKKHLSTITGACIAVLAAFIATSVEARMIIEDGKRAKPKTTAIAVKPQAGASVRAKTTRAGVVAPMFTPKAGKAGVVGPSMTPGARRAGRTGIVGPSMTTGAGRTGAIAPMFTPKAGARLRSGAANTEEEGGLQPRARTGKAGIVGPAMTTGAGRAGAIAPMFTPKAGSRTGRTGAIAPMFTPKATR